MIILKLPDFFREKSPDTYPPFKNGRYLEEYFYEHFLNNLEKFANINLVYIPVFWTNLQVSSNFEEKKPLYINYLTELYKLLPAETKYFTIVQHDDAIYLPIPKNTIIFGACSGHIPLPLIYEDKATILETKRASNNFTKSILCSFLGALTHACRTTVIDMYNNNPNFYLHTKPWELVMDQTTQDHFVNTTLQSHFTLCPRGYGRNSFRFFEAIILESIPIYIYTDVNWLPYQEIIDYSKFSIVINSNDVQNLNIILEDALQKKDEMITELRNHKHFFTLDYMCEYILNYLTNNLTNIELPLYTNSTDIIFIN